MKKRILIILSVLILMLTNITTKSAYAASKNNDIQEIRLKVGETLKEATNRQCAKPYDEIEGLRVITEGAARLDTEDFAFMQGEVINLANLNLKEAKCEGDKIPDNAFSPIVNGDNVGKKNFKELILPDSIVEIGDNAFRRATFDCETIVIPASVKKVGYRAFGTTVGYNEIVLQEGLEDIQEKAFEWTTGVSKELYLPSSLKNIGDNAFYKFGIPGKNGTVTIPSGIKNIGNSAFQNSGISGVIFEEGFSLSKINSKVFYVASLKGTIHIPNSVKELGDGALAYTGADEIILPEGLTTIGNGVFTGNTKLKNLTIPKSVEKIGTALTQLLSSLEEFNYYASAEYEFDKNILSTELKKVDMKGSGVTKLNIVNVPTLKTVNVSGCQKLSEVKINYLPNVEYLNLMNCPSLKTIELTENINFILECDDTLKDKSIAIGRDGYISDNNLVASYEGRKINIKEAAGTATLVNGDNKIIIHKNGGVITTPIVMEGKEVTYNGQQHQLTAMVEGLSNAEFDYQYAKQTHNDNYEAISGLPIDAGYYKVTATPTQGYISEPAIAYLTIHKAPVKDTTQTVQIQQGDISLQEIDLKRLLKEAGLPEGEKVSYQMNIEDENRIINKQPTISNQSIMNFNLNEIIPADKTAIIKIAVTPKSQNYQSHVITIRLVTIKDKVLPKILPEIENGSYIKTKDTITISFSKKMIGKPIIEVQGGRGKGDAQLSTDGFSMIINMTDLDYNTHYIFKITNITDVAKNTLDTNILQYITLKKPNNSADIDGDLDRPLLPNDGSSTLKNAKIEYIDQVKTADQKKFMQDFNKPEGYQLTSFFFTLDLRINGKLIENTILNQKMEVTIPFVAQPNKTYMVAHLKYDGTIEYLHTEYSKQKLSFYVDSFSPFAILSKEVNVIEKPLDKGVETSDFNESIQIKWIILFISAGGYILLHKLQSFKKNKH